MKKAILAVVIASTLAQDVFANRGATFEYDPGPAKDSKWPDLFAETPNYRAFGKAVIGGRGEKFRWNMGPMFYRGRLTPNSVKVFIIGQEGAQDENVSNRSFTGSTGTRLQNFINYLGINESYLYMNTFVYTISGQYSLFGEDKDNASKVQEQQRLLWLAQNPDSIVVEHRHKLFDYMLETNQKTLSLVIGVGTAGKDSLATWFQAHGSKCTSWTLSRGYCEGEGKLSGVIGIGVVHPGGASDRNGGAGAASRIMADFSNKAKIVANRISKDSSWLPTDRGAKRSFSRPFRYGYASIPHRDFAFGTPWVMGAYSTTSNRRGADSIQIFSKDGCYNNAARVNGRCSADQAEKLRYDDPKDLLGAAPREMTSVDVPYEPPKSEKMRREFDEGPGALAADLLGYFDATQAFSSKSTNTKEAGITQHMSFGHTGIYRGRAESAKVLVIADQVSHTDMFSGRALTGAAGQRLQTFLEAAGAQKDYFILRSLPVDCLDKTVEACTEVAMADKVFDARLKIINEVLEAGNVRLVVAVGPTAKAIVSAIDFSTPVVKLEQIAVGTGHVKEYQEALKQIRSLKVNLGGKATYQYDGSLSVIPRADLPAMTRWAMGTSGDQGARAFQFTDGERVDNGNYYQVYVPKWVTRWRADASQLNSEEKKSLEAFKKTGL